MIYQSLVAIMIALWISTNYPRGLPSHVTPGRCPYIPSFFLTRGGGRFLLLYRVVALMEWLLRLLRASIVLSSFVAFEYMVTGVERF